MYPHYADGEQIQLDNQNRPVTMISRAKVNDDDFSTIKEQLRNINASNIINR